ncbi:MAG TPA: cytidylate kinase family protein [Candidatus Nanoarchaeia archaeon]|nr:cytidylate kinase family protein [Candidatus Nanoarchaeia archaeon]
MKITLSGALGSGKSTVAKLVAQKLNLKHYSTGDFMREIAIRRKVTLLELNKLAETDPSVDKELDERQIKLRKEEDHFIIDARLGWHFIPDSIKVFLNVTDEEAARRIFAEKRKDERYNTTLDLTLENIKRRKESETKRYQQYYGVNYFNLKNYDLIIDTTKLTAKEVADKLIEFVRKKR